jgi:hypothetical protein
MLKKWKIFWPLTLLLFPLLGMLVSTEIKWGVFDFIIMGIFLTAFSLGINQAFKKSKNIKFRIFIVGIIILLFFLVWAELAIGIIGTPFAGN